MHLYHLRKTDDCVKPVQFIPRSKPLKHTQDVFFINANG
jgi:hypothetical protein